MFRLVCDNDSHWFVIPADQSAHWNMWTEIASEDERAWTPPAYAIAVDGGPGSIVFDVWGKRA